MSTNIQHGIRLNGISTVADLSTFWKRAREHLLPVLQKEYKELLYQYKAILTLAQMDKVSLDWVHSYAPHLFVDDKPIPADLFRIHRHLASIAPYDVEGMSSDFNYRDLDFRAKLGVYPVNGKILALPFINNSAMKKAFLELPEVKEYGYWDSTDPDETVSPEEWKQREQDWDEALPGIGIPRESGMTIELTSYPDMDCNFMDDSDVDVAAIAKETLEDWGYAYYTLTQEQVAAWRKETGCKDMVPTSTLIGFRQSTTAEEREAKIKKALDFLTGK